MPEKPISLSCDDIDMIFDWFVKAHRDRKGSCGPAANLLIERLGKEYRRVVC